MKKIIKEICRNIVLFFIGGGIYMGIELAWRARTHWTMGILGGLCFIIVGGINNYFDWDMLFWKQCLIGGCIITALEFITGCILNLWLGLGVWDYSNVVGNVYGQICIPFTIIWIFLAGVAIVLDDFFRWALFDEDFPKYNFI